LESQLGRPAAALALLLLVVWEGCEPSREKACSRVPDGLASVPD